MFLPVKSAMKIGLTAKYAKYAKRFSELLFAFFAWFAVEYSGSDQP